jgi:hypothetical protein
MATSTIVIFLADVAGVLAGFDIPPLGGVEIVGLLIDPLGVLVGVIVGLVLGAGVVAVPGVPLWAWPERLKKRPVDAIAIPNVAAIDFWNM